MEGTQLISPLLVAFGGLVTILLGVLAWIGNRAHSRLDSTGKEVADIDKRVVKIETVMSFERRADGGSVK